MTDKLLIGRAVVQQALEAMLNFPDDISDEMFESIRALRAALAQQPGPVNVAGLSIAAQSTIGRWLNEDMDRAVANGANSISMPDELVEIAAWLHALAALAQPQRPPLTDEEMLGIIDAELEGGSLLDVARAVERKVRGEA